MTNKLKLEGEIGVLADIGRSRFRVRKAFRVSAGFLLMALGLILAIPGVPGPGWLLVFLGLGILAEHFHWARRVLDWAKAKWESMRRAKPKKERKGAGSGQ